MSDQERISWDLIAEKKNSSEKFIYFLLGTVASAIAYSAYITSDSKITLSTLFIILSGLFWLFSF